MADFCEWTHYIHGTMWHTECGKTQGIKVNPKQKKCYCGKTIKRVQSDVIDEKAVQFQKILNIIR